MLRLTELTEPHSEEGPDIPTFNHARPGVLNQSSILHRKSLWYIHLARVI